MSNVLKQYLKECENRSWKKNNESLVEEAKPYHKSKTLTGRKLIRKEIDSMKHIQMEFEEYITVLFKTIYDNIETLKAIKHNKYDKQIKELKQELRSIAKSIMRSKRTINFYTDFLIDHLPPGGCREGCVLNRRDIKRLKINDTHPIMEAVFYDPILPQDPLFQLIKFYLFLNHDAIQLCLLQQQIHDIAYEQEVEPKMKKGMLYLQNFINEKMSDIKEEMNMFNDTLNQLLSIQMDANYRSEDIHSETRAAIENRNKLEKTKTLKTGVCLDLIESILKTAKEDIHYESIRKRLSGWNTYIKTEGERGEEPLAGYDYAIRQTPDYFRQWVWDTFLPDYRKRVRKNGDALKGAVHGHKILE